MVALLQPTRHLSPRSTRPASTPHLRLVVDNTVARSPRLAPSSVAAVAAVMAMVLVVVLIRGVQGAPPADTWSGLSTQAGSSASVLDAGASSVAQDIGASSEVSTITVAAFDTWASIAARVAPGDDPVEFARRVAEVNGGYRLSEGQVLVLPTMN